MAKDAPRRTRSGGRAGNARRTTSLCRRKCRGTRRSTATSRPEPLDGEGVEAIHKGCMRILSEIGIEFLNPEACEIPQESRLQGRRHQCQNGRGFRDGDGRHAPSEFTIIPRNPDRAITMGGKNLLFGNVSSPPNSWTLEQGKQSGSFEMYKDFIKLTQFFNCIHFAGGYPVEPIDIHAGVRHLDCLFEKLTLTERRSTPIPLVVAALRT